MRVRNKPWAKERVEEFPQYVVSEPAIWRGRWEERFGNNQPLHIEVGSGKGQFIYGMAKSHPDINYIAIEIQLSVLVDILDKQVAEPLANLQILHVDGGSVTDYFTPHEISQVYLNFSDPWPKSRHAKRRLTYHTFLKGYEEILPLNGELHFKTDNRGLFEYSLASFSQYGMVLNQVWLDLHASNFEGNIMTEYEQKFAAKGQPIYRVEAYFPESK